MEREALREQCNNARAEAELPPELPADMEVRRAVTARSIEMRVGNARRAWRACPDTACRRARACLALGVRCCNPPPVDPSREQLDRAIALAKKSEALEAAVLARRAAEKAAADKAAAKKKAKQKSKQKSWYDAWPRTIGH